MHHTDYDTRLAAYAWLVDDSDRVLLTWFNGSAREEPCWSLPGGGVDYEETLVEGLVREVSEESGYDVVVGRPLVTDTWTDPDRERPHKSVRVVFDAEIVGGVLGTLEVGGSTDRAEWLPLDDLLDVDLPRSGIVDVALAAWRELPA